LQTNCDPAISEWGNLLGSNPQDGKTGKPGEMPQMDKISQGQQKMTEGMKQQMEQMKNGKKTRE